MIDEPPMNPILARRRRIILALCLIPLTIEMHKAGMFGFATFTAGPEWLRLFVLVPGLLALALIFFGARYARSHRGRWLPATMSTLADGIDKAADFAFGELPKVCTHEYPNGALFCIYCGQGRIPQPTTGATVQLRTKE